MLDKIKAGIFGLAVADALGVPVEFQSRDKLSEKPVVDMRGYGTYNQSPGTWSNDTSMTLCTMDSLAERGVDYDDIMKKFSSWALHGNYTPYQELFDIGNTTRQALLRYGMGFAPIECGGKDEYSNGNGSLMRILPVAYYINTKYEESQDMEDIVTLIHDISALTHGHQCSQIACSIYVMIALNLMRGDTVNYAVEKGVKSTFAYYSQNPLYTAELCKYNRLRERTFKELPLNSIRSTGYVVDSLEASLWCLLTTDNYKSCVLKAANLGEDTDTVAAIAGGLAGIAYGMEAIPGEWLDCLARKDFIDNICNKFMQSIKEELELASKNKDAVTGIATGFTDLDSMTNGLQPSYLVVIASRPSMGKTTLALNIARFVAMEKKLSVAIFSLEMSKEQMMNRLQKGIGEMRNVKLIIDDTANLSTTEIFTKCRKIQKEHGLDLIFIDYLDLMSAGAKTFENQNLKRSEISRSLKALAVEMKASVIVTAQLNKTIEHRQNKRPMLSDLRDRGATEQDADVIMFLYRDGYYNKDSEHKNDAEIIIAKQRNGPLGTVTLGWQPETTGFVNL